jgi:hypothetical protein
MKIMTNEQKKKVVGLLSFDLTIPLVAQPVIYCRNGDADADSEAEFEVVLAVVVVVVCVALPLSLVVPSQGG